MQCTFGSSTVVIWRSCSGDVRPFGYMMKQSTPALPRRPWMAAGPMSPLVAPRMVSVAPSPLRLRKYSKRLPSSCSATSLKANVGPWNSSSTYRFACSCVTGVTSACRKACALRSTRSRRSAAGIWSSCTYLRSTKYITSVHGCPRSSSISSGSTSGIVSGTNRPLSRHSPPSTTSSKVEPFWPPRVLW